EVPLIAAVNGPVRLHYEYILLADDVLATPSTVFQDKPHFELEIVRSDGVNLLWSEVIGSVRGHCLTRQDLSPETAKEWDVVDEKLLIRAREIAERLAKFPRSRQATPELRWSRTSARKGLPHDQGELCALVGFHRCVCVLYVSTTIGS